MTEREFARQMDEFKRDRRDALLSMDKDTILAFGQKWAVSWQTSSEDVFWIAVHMARTGAKDLPMEARTASKRWLRDRGYRSMDDGDVPT
jgi:hypothetical protein